MRISQELLSHLLQKKAVLIDHPLDKIEGFASYPTDQKKIVIVLQNEKY